MIQNLNPVRPKIRLDGEEISFESLVLEQEMNACHRFEVVKEHMSHDELWQVSLGDQVAHIGSNLLIRFEHLDAGIPYEFSGVVTDVQIEAWETSRDMGTCHRSNRIHIIGSGDIVKLDGAKGRDSFVDCQLMDVVTQLVEKVGIPLSCEPNFKGVLPFLMRYDESVFSFLNRLSSIFGEAFYYDGKKIHFGVADKGEVEPLFFDKDIISLRTSAQGVPHRTSAYDYFFEEDVYTTNEGNFSASGVLREIEKRADTIFEEMAVQPSAASLSSSYSLKDMMDLRQQMLAGVMYNVEGETRTCNLRLGGIVEIAFPPKMNVGALGRFRVVALVHRIDKNGNYSNHFKAIPECVESLPLKISFPKAYPELAVVSDNEDPMGLGRVQVQFEWQKPKWQSTNWIRILMPNGGGSVDVPRNRGFVFIPEKGDQVMVGFEYGDPNRPYVIGSLYSGSMAAGGGDGNAVKSIKTRGGHQIIFNDDENGEYGITISDKNGNTIQLDTSGMNVTISSQNSISLLAKNISIDAGEAMTISSKGTMIVNAEEDLKVLSGVELEVSSNSLQVSAVEGVSYSSDFFEVNAKTSVNLQSKKVEIDSTDDNLILATGGDVDVQSKGKVNLF